MTESLRRLLQNPIDYAGLFPPASLSMQDALQEYGKAMDGEDEWIVNRFVCPVGRLTECQDVLKQALSTDGEPAWIDLAVVGTPLTGAGMATESIQKDMAVVKSAFAFADISTFEIKVPLGAEFAGCLSVVKRAFNWFDERDVEVYIELPWGQGMTEAMAEAASVIDGVGFKARTGGTEPEQFPDPRDFAAFIVEAARLEALNKYTAGLHQPVRHYDSSTTSYHHGFLNAMVASILATIQDATTHEVEQILNIQEASEFLFTDQGIELQGKKISLKDIDEWWLFFGGFGSCSYKEPIEGLKRLGWV